MLDAEHDLAIDVEAAHIKVSRTDIARIVGHEELGVQLLRLIFPDLRPAPEQPDIAVARSRDGHRVVGFRGRDDPQRPTFGQAADPAQCTGVGREIGGDDVEALRAPDVRLEGPRPRTEPLRRATEQPAQIAALLALADKAAIERANLRLRIARPSQHRVEIAVEMSRRRPLDQQTEIAPILFGRSEIAFGDVEPTNQRLAIVGECQLLVIAQQIAPAEAWQKPTDRSAGIAQRREECIPSPFGAEAIDQQRHLHASSACRRQRITHLHADGIIPEDVVKQPQFALRTVDQRDQRI